MTDNNAKKNLLAETIAETKADIETITKELKEMTDMLVDLVGEEGETFTTTMGAVQVTQKTDDRTTNDIVTSFDVERFLALDIKTQNKIRGLGVVKQERKVVKGQAPKVVVRLR